MSGSDSNVLVQVLYLISAILFIVGLKGLTRVRSARRGNAISALAMLIAIVATVLELGAFNPKWILLGVVIGSVIGLVAAIRVQMTGIPEMVALFNGCGGAASALVALSVIWYQLFERTPEVGQPLLTSTDSVTTMLSVIIGCITFTGSIVAFLKLRGWISGQPILLPARHFINALLVLASIGLLVAFVQGTDPAALETLAVAAAVVTLALGVLLVIPIGGADMPVVISLLNSYSGLAACATGFVLSNNVLIISGALVGASGLILTQIMCVAMNRSLANVLFGGFGIEAPATAAGGGARDYKNVKSYSAEEAALVLDAAESVIFVPGYGLAVAQAQHIVRELAEELQKQGVDVKYAIHPVAGRMPGHMNVLLAEADVPYEQLVEMDAINPEFRNTDVVLVVGANDVVNPAAANDKTSPIYGMPILEVHHARTVMIIKRSLSPGFAGIKNDLFEYDNSLMLFGDAKKVLQDLLKEIKEAR